MPAIKTAGFHYGRDAFTKATETLAQGKPAHFDAAGLEEAIGLIVGLIREKGYSEQDVIDALRGAEEEITGTTLSDERSAILRALVRKALKAERQARQEASAKPLPAGKGVKSIGKGGEPVKPRKPSGQQTAPAEPNAGTGSTSAAGAPMAANPAASNQAGPKPDAAPTAGGVAVARPGGSAASDYIRSMLGTRPSRTPQETSPRDGGSAERSQAGRSSGSGGN